MSKASNNQTRTRKVLSGALLCLMMLSAGGISAYIRVKDVHLQKIPIYPANNRQVASIPTQTPSWRQIGSDELMGAELVETLGTENYVSRNYLRTRDADPKKPIVINFHAAYYTGMIDTVPHVPERCFVGGGLQQSESSRVIPLPMPTDSWREDPSVAPEFAGLGGQIYSVRLSNDPKQTDAPGQRVRLPRGISPDRAFDIRASEFYNPGKGNIYAGYFFIANGGTKANANDVRQLAFNLDDDYAYFLKVQVSGSGFESFDAFAQYSGELLGELIGEIMRCVPDWVEVQEGVYPEGNPRGGVGTDEG